MSNISLVLESDQTFNVFLQIFVQYDTHFIRSHKIKALPKKTGLKVKDKINLEKYSNFINIFYSKNPKFFFKLISISFQIANEINLKKILIFGEETEVCSLHLKFSSTFNARRPALTMGTFSHTLEKKMKKKQEKTRKNEKKRSVLFSFNFYFLYR